MMKKVKKFIEDISLNSNIIITILGIIILVSLFVVSKYPKCRTAIMASCISGGLINIINGLKIIKDPKKVMTGMPFIMVGTIIIILGFVIISMI